MLVVNDVINAIETKKMSKELEQFVIRWLSNTEKTDEDRNFMKELAVKDVYPAQYTNLFRGCTNICDDVAESYSNSVIVAARFATNNGYIIAIDTGRFCYATFDLSNFVWEMINDIVYEGKENIYSEELIDLCEEMSGEDEIIVVTDIEQSVVMKVVKIGEEL